MNVEYYGVTITYYSNVPLWKGKFIAGHKNATYGSIEAGQFTPFGTLFIKIGISSK